MPAPTNPTTSVERTAFDVPLTAASPKTMASSESCDVRLCSLTAQRRSTLNNAVRSMQPNAMLFQGAGSSSLDAGCQPRGVHCGWDASVLPDATRPNLESVAVAQPRRWQAPSQISELAPAHAGPAAVMAGAPTMVSASLYVKGLPPGRFALWAHARLRFDRGL
jgi:hypothetical protein